MVEYNMIITILMYIVGGMIGWLLAEVIVMLYRSWKMERARTKYWEIILILN